MIVFNTPEGQKPVTHYVIIMTTANGRHLPAMPPTGIAAVSLEDAEKMKDTIFNNNEAIGGPSTGAFLCVTIVEADHLLERAEARFDREDIVPLFSDAPTLMGLVSHEWPMDVAEVV